MDEQATAAQQSIVGMCVKVCKRLGTMGGSVFNCAIIFLTVLTVAMGIQQTIDSSQSIERDVAGQLLPSFSAVSGMVVSQVVISCSSHPPPPFLFLFLFPIFIDLLPSLLAPPPWCCCGGPCHNYVLLVDGLYFLNLNVSPPPCPASLTRCHRRL